VPKTTIFCPLQLGVLQRHLTPHPKELKRQQQSEVLQRHRQKAQEAMEAAKAEADGQCDGDQRPQCSCIDR